MPDHRVKRITFNADADLLEQAAASGLSRGAARAAIATAVEKERLQARAKKALGTTSATDAINRSLAEVVRSGSLQSLARDGVPGLTPEMLRELRRPRTF